MGHEHISQRLKAISPSQTQSNAIAKNYTHPIEELQGVFGNRALNQLLANRPTLPPKPIFRGLSRELGIQPKLTIGAVGDKYEQEADRVASQVVKQIHAPVTAQSTQEHSVKEDLQAKSILQRREAIAGGEASKDLTSAINGARGSGQPLDAGLKKSMGQAMGADFSGVKVHADAQSDELNQSLQAKAFTTGQDVFFRQGAYEPGSRGGQELIAHELTHVVQQNGGAVQRSPLPPQQFQQHPPTYTASNSQGDLIIQRVVTNGSGKGTPKMTMSEVINHFHIKEHDQESRMIVEAVINDSTIHELRVLQEMLPLAYTPPLGEELRTTLNNATDENKVHMPLGFNSYEDFQLFITKTYQKMPVSDAIIIFHGSSLTGQSYQDKGGGSRLFDRGRDSDYDVAIASLKLWEMAKKINVKIRNDHSEPLTNQQLVDLGLRDAHAEAYFLARREVNFMLYESEVTAKKHEGPALIARNASNYLEIVGELQGDIINGIRR